MKNILIVLLGNRDLQISKNASIPISDVAYFVVNNDDNNFMTISTRHQDKTFLQISQKIEDEYETTFKNVLSFPMLDSYISLIPNEIEKIIFTTSKQSPLDKQDCFHVGNLATQFYREKGYDVEFIPFSCNPTNFGELVNFFIQLYNQNQNRTIYFGNSGGTPDMRAATYFAGIFRNIEFITINARNKMPNKSNFKHQERLILRHTVEEMLKVFDYEGINQLPIGNEAINALAQYAQARIALNFEKAKNIAKRLDTDTFFQVLLTEVDKNMTIKDLECETYFSAKIKYAQGAYSDYLWRLFTIHDNMFIPITESLLNGRVIFNKKDEHSEWNNLINSKPDLIEYLEKKEINNRPLAFREPNKFAYKAIVDYFYPKGNSNRPNFIDDINSCLERLGSLRNAVAHNYKGIGLEDIEQNLPKKYKTTFNELLSNFVGKSWEDFGIYEQINEEILKRFEA